jgi:hypothetical protein
MYKMWSAEHSHSVGKFWATHSADPILKLTFVIMALYCNQEKLGPQLCCKSEQFLIK